MSSKILFSLFFLLLLQIETGIVCAQDLGLESIAPTIGLIYSPDSKEPGILAGFSSNVGEITRGIEIYPALAYWYTEKNSHSRSALQFSVDAKYFFSSYSGFYAGGGFSMNYAIEKSNGSSQKDTYFQPGGALVVGNEQFFGKNTWFVQLKLDVTNDFNAISLSTGLFFDLYR